MTPLSQALSHILKVDQGMKLVFYDSTASFTTAQTLSQLSSSQLGEVFVLPAPVAQQYSPTETRYGASSIQITPEELIGPCKYMVLATIDDYLLAYEEFSTPISFAAAVISTIAFTSGYIFSLRNVT
jgi:hypothetical protein